MLWGLPRVVSGFLSSWLNPKEKCGGNWPGAGKPFLVAMEECAGGGALSLNCRVSVMYRVHLCRRDLSVCVIRPLTPQRATVSLSCERVFGVPRPLTPAVMERDLGTGQGSLALRKGTRALGRCVARGGMEARAVEQRVAHWEQCQLRAQRKGACRDEDSGDSGERVSGLSGRS